jgi:hypothetical protein
MTKMGYKQNEFGLGQVFVNPTIAHKEPLTKHQTLVVNLFAGPGTGKSTTCSGIFFDLKNLQINCEMAFEYAKELVWEKRDFTFSNQIYLFGKQHHRITRLLGQVDVVITDCPILLSPVYDGEQRPTLEKLVVEEHNKMWTYNVFLTRKKAYNPIGRRSTHDLAAAQEIDKKVLDVLDRNNQCYETFEASPEGKIAIVKKILLLLENRPSTKGLARLADRHHGVCPRRSGKASVARFRRIGKKRNVSGGYGRRV